jgi:hypothetical protein
MSTLRGNLQSISLMDVVQLLHVNRKTGKLYVTQGKQSGILFVQSGEVIHAETPQVLGESAAFEILEWDKGEFEFMALKFTCPNSIRRSVPDLLMEAARTSDSRKHLKGIFPNLHAVPYPTLPQPELTRGLKLFAEDRKVLPFLDGYRTFLEVMAVAEQSEVAVLQTARMLKEAGRLTLLDPALHLTVRPLKTGLFKKADHVELSRSAEAKWKTIGPYGQAPITNVRIVWPEGPAISPVTFVGGLDEQVVAIPKELMQSWGLPEGIFVSIRPAP